ncbi:MAG: hypothetical protein ACYTGG_11955 [Planctomycetota bacterium]
MNECHVVPAARRVIGEEQQIARDVKPRDPEALVREVGVISEGVALLRRAREDSILPEEQPAANAEGRMIRHAGRADDARLTDGRNPGRVNDLAGLRIEQVARQRHHLELERPARGSRGDAERDRRHRRRSDPRGAGVAARPEGVAAAG